MKLKKYIFHIISLILCAISIILNLKEVKAFNIEPVESIVAEVSIFAYYDTAQSDSSLSHKYGHVFILVDNLSSNSITVGKLSINAKSSVTIGTWENKGCHSGVFYNLESYFANNGSYKGRVSITEAIASEQLVTLSNNICNNDAWTTINNGSNFAIKVWNSFSSTNIKSSIINTREKLRNNLLKLDYKTNKSIDFNPKIGYCEFNIYIAYNISNISLADLNDCSL